MKARIPNFAKERNEALFSLDRERIEAYMKKYNIEMPEDETVFWAGVYKGICNVQNAPEDLVEKAKKWLNEHGMSPEITNGYGKFAH